MLMVVVKRDDTGIVSICYLCQMQNAKQYLGRWPSHPICVESACWQLQIEIT